MHTASRYENWGMDLTDVLAGCSSFNGLWPSELNLYPSFWRRYLKQGRGIGKGKKYRPYIRVRDFGSEGTSHITFGIKSRRRHHFFSDYEFLYFLLLERRKGAIWAMEQWPILDLVGTLRLAAELGVSHPYSKGFPAPVTVDFVTCERCASGERSLAVAVKSPEDAQDPQVLKELGLQQTWCENHGLPWALADMSVIRDVRTAIESLKFIRWWFRFGTEPPWQDMADRFTEMFLAGYCASSTLGELTSITGERLRLKPQVADDLFRFAAWNSDIPVDIQSPIQRDRPLVLLDEH